jgi:hypothetical protein
MGIEHLTVGTCERCGMESRFEHPLGHDYYRDAAKWESQWAKVWPANTTPFHGAPGSGQHGQHSQLVCVNCLTEAEREQLREAQVRIEEEGAFPF